MRGRYINVDDEMLCGWISSAKDFLLYIAPGASVKVAEHLAEKIDELDPGNVIISIDPEAHTLRLGYGHVEGMRLLFDKCSKAGIDLFGQPGLRLGALISDEDVIVFSPTALIIEEASTDPTQPNGFALASKMEGDRDMNEVIASLIGEPIGTVIEKEEMEQVEKELSMSPPRKFDLARREMVFSSRLQFVEFELKNYKLSQRIVPFPSELLGLAANEELASRMRSQFKVFAEMKDLECEVKTASGESRILSERKLEEIKKGIVDKYLIRLPGYGNVLDISQRSEFDQDVLAFQHLLEQYEEKIRDKITEHLKKTTEQLIVELMPRVQSNPPADLRKRTSQIPCPVDEARDYLEKKLRKILGTVSRLFKPELRVVYKNVAYESFSDERFVFLLEREFGKNALSRILDEHDALPEVPGSDDNEQDSLFQ